MQDRQLPDLTLILDNLYIGNLASARTLHEHPELGITHVLSVCPERPEAQEAHEGITSSLDAPCPSITRPLYASIPVQDSENEDILSHLPKAVDFISNALDDAASGSTSFRAENGNVAEERGLGGGSSLSTTSLARKHRVLVHCVMGISRSSTVVCAYLMATRNLSLSAALVFLRKRRPLVHPNFGFRKQLVIFAENEFFRNWTQPIRAHPAWTAWQKKKKKEVARYLARVGDMIELNLEDPAGARLSLTEDFPTDPLEAASLLNEAEVTHFLTISPTSIPPLPPSPPSPSSSPIIRPAFRAHIPASLSMTTTTSASTSDSAVSSPISSRSSSFSGGSLFSLPSLSPPSTAGTSVYSLFPPISAKSAPEASALEFEEEEDDVEPTFLAVACVKHYHLPIAGPSSVDMLVKMNEGASFIQCSLQPEETGCEKEKPPIPTPFSTPLIKPHVLIHSTIESRGVIVACAYLMQARGQKPSEAYNIVEKALPLFNPTKSFLKQLELYHDCQYHPTRDHPLIRAATSSEHPSLKSCPFSIHPSIAKLKEESSTNSDDKEAIDADSDRDGHVLRKALSTPMRSGSFSSNYGLTPAHSRKPSMSHHSSSGSGPGLGLMRRTSSTMSSLAMHRKSSESSGEAVRGVDVEKLLQKCEGVGDPGFSFDVEAFRGALKGIAEERHKECLA